MQRSAPGLQDLHPDLAHRILQRLNDQNVRAVALAARPSPRGRGGAPDLASHAAAELLNRSGRRKKLQGAVRKALRRHLEPLIGAVVQGMHIATDPDAGAILARQPPAAAARQRWHMVHGNMVKVLRLPGSPGSALRLTATKLVRPRVAFEWVHLFPSPIRYAGPPPTVFHTYMGELEYVSGRWRVSDMESDGPPRRDEPARTEYTKVVQIVNAVQQAALESEDRRPAGTTWRARKAAPRAAAVV